MQTPNNLGKLMAERGFTVRSLSEQSGVSSGSIGNFKTGTRGIGKEALQRIAETLNVKIADIIGDHFANNIMATGNSAPVAIHSLGARQEIKGKGSCETCQRVAEYIKSIDSLRHDMEEMKTQLSDIHVLLVKLLAK